MKNKKWKATLYLRLSKDDGQAQESGSIKNQRELLRSFLKSYDDIDIISEKIDDGVSGINFDRPAFNEMIADIHEGVINCVVVKDLSRFGRDHLEVGTYLEHIFPFQGVRFISIGENYDTIQGTNADYLITTFKTIFADIYSKDMSKKIKSAKDKYAKEGKYVSGFVPYGYVKSDTAKNKIEIDPEAAEIVRTVFQKFLDGTTQIQIAKEMNEQNVLIPSEYKKSKGLYGQKSGGSIKAWTGATVKYILTNEIHKGTYVYGKKKVACIGSTKVKTVPREERIIIENSHEAIISSEIFQKAQMKMKAKKNVKKSSFHVLAGLVKCGVCGRCLKLLHGEFQCIFSTASPELACHRLRLPEKDLVDLLHHLIKMQLELLVEKETLMQAQPNVVNLNVNRKNLHTKEKEFVQWSNRTKNLFEDYVEEKISEEVYQRELQEYTKCQKSIGTEIKDIEQKIITATQELEKDKSWKKAVYIVNTNTDVTEDLINLMIKEIFVNSSDDIKICWNYC